MQTGNIMNKLTRFGVSTEQSLLEDFDAYIESRGYDNRSEAIRDLIRDALIQHRIEPNAEEPVIGSLTIVYDHHARNLLADMNAIQHDFHDSIISVMHLHVSHDDCMEIIALKGAAETVSNLSHRLLSLKGVKNGKLFLTLPSSQI